MYSQSLFVIQSQQNCFSLRGGPQNSLSCFLFLFCFSLVSFSYRPICHQSCGVIYYTFKMGRVNRKNNHHVSLGLKARLGFGFYDH